MKVRTVCWDDLLQSTSLFVMELGLIGQEKYFKVGSGKKRRISVHYYLNKFVINEPIWRLSAAEQCDG